MSFMVFKPTASGPLGSSGASSLPRPRADQMSAPATVQTRPAPQVQIPFPESIQIFDPTWHPPTPQSQARPLHQYPASPYQNPSPRYTAQQARDKIPPPATLTAPGVTIGAIALTCYDELALIRYCVDFQGYYRSGYRTKFWVSARKGLSSVVGKDVEDVEQRMRVLLAKRRVEKRILEEHGVLRKAFVMPEYRELLDKWDDRVRYVESGEEKVQSRQSGMDDGDSEGVETPVKANPDIPHIVTPSSNSGWIIESPARGNETSEEPSPAQGTGDKPHRTRLKPAEEVVLLRLCVQHKDLYKALFKATFWKFIQKKLEDETGKHFTNPDGRIKVLLKRRESERKELKERGRLQIDLVDRQYKQWLDKWQEVLDEVGGHRKRRTRDASEIRNAEEVFRNTMQTSPRNLSATVDASSHNGIIHPSNARDTDPDHNPPFSLTQISATDPDHGRRLREQDEEIRQVRVEHDKIMQDLTADLTDNAALKQLILRLEANRFKQMDLHGRRLDTIRNIMTAAMAKERDEMQKQLQALQQALAA